MLRRADNRQLTSCMVLPCFVIDADFRIDYRCKAALPVTVVVAVVAAAHLTTVIEGIPAKGLFDAGPADRLGSTVTT